MERDSYEFVGEKDEAVGRLLASLPRVEAPSDFEMRVRARIASGRSAGPSWLTPLVRVAVPAALLVAIGGYLGYYSFFQSQPGPPPVAVTQPETRPVPATDLPEDTSDPPANPSIAESSTPAFDRQSGNIRHGPQRGTDRTGDQTRTLDDQALSVANPILQQGLNANTRAVANVDRSVSGAGVSAKEYFEAIGIRALFKSKTWKVGSVTANSLAEKAGVKAGDILEALNDETLTDKTSLGRTFTATSLRVRRDGQSIKLDLKP